MRNEATRRISPIQWTLGLAALLAVGCSGDPEQKPLPDAVDAADAADTQSADVAPLDTILDDLTSDLPGTEDIEVDLADVAAPNPCLQALAEGEAFELYASGPDTQIHTDLAFDGEALWVAFNGPAEGSSNFAVLVTRIACDGSVLVPPTVVSMTEGGNQVDPEIVASGDKVLVAWQADSGVFPNNMDTLYRVFDRSGEGILDVLGALEPTLNGVAQPGNVWMPRAVGMGDGTFALSASLAMAEYTGFQLILQKIDAEGLLVGEAIHVRPEASFSQVYAGIARMGEKDLALIWESETTEDSEALYGFLPDGAASIETVLKARKDGPSTGGDIAGLTSGDAFVVYAADIGGEMDVWLRPAAPEAMALRSFGEAGKVDIAPALALSGEGGAVGWYRSISGQKYDIIAQPFLYAGGFFEVTSAFRQINTLPAAPYALAMEHLAGPYYFFSWSQGTSPKFRVVGRFVKLP